MARKKKQKKSTKPKRRTKPKAPNDPTITARDRRYRTNQKRDGFAHVRVFVPRDQAPVIRDLAFRLREGVRGPEYLHELVMQRFNILMKLDPAPESSDGHRLLELVDILHRYEKATEGTA